MNIPKIYKYRFYFLGALFILTMLAAWPGYMNPDSMNQYTQAVIAQYNDHHPPLMSFVWHYLDLIHHGVGLMFTFQIGLLYAGIAVLLITLDKLVSIKQRWLGLFLIVLPIYPQVLIYAITVVKDTQYAFSFLLAGSVLAYYTVTHKRIPPLVILGLFLILIYGAAVKYQGKFCVVVPAVWLGCLLLRRFKLWKRVAVGLLIYVTIISSITLINHLLVPNKSKSLSWQCVKLYDLAAISLALNHDLIPDYNKTAFYSFERLQLHFDYPSVDSCIYVKNSILRVVREPARMNVLYRVWLTNVIKHPVVYIKHRIRNMSYMLLSRPGFIYAEPIINKLPNTWYQNVIYQVNNVLFYTFMSHLPIVILGVLYFCLAIAGWRHSKAAPVLLGFTSTALGMVAILFFMSMAGSPRYTYISIVMIHAMHGFAYVCYQDSKKVKT